MNCSAQRPSARDLLKHKFVRMAKKTNYLTELIERHEQWKAQGGDRTDDDDKHGRAPVMYGCSSNICALSLTFIQDG